MVRPPRHGASHDAGKENIRGRTLLRRTRVLAGRPIRARGSQVVCPFCGWSGRSFDPAGAQLRPNRACPRCQSMERHRMLYLFLREQTTFFTAPGRILEIAPRGYLPSLLPGLRDAQFVGSDLDGRRAGVDRLRPHQISLSERRLRLRHLLPRPRAHPRRPRRSHGATSRARPWRHSAGPGPTSPDPSQSRTPRRLPLNEKDGSAKPTTFAATDLTSSIGSNRRDSDAEFEPAP